MKTAVDILPAESSVISPVISSRRNRWELPDELVQVARYVASRSKHYRYACLVFGGRGQGHPSAQLVRCDDQSSVIPSKVTSSTALRTAITRPSIVLVSLKSASLKSRQQTRHCRRQVNERSCYWPRC
jgi:hypothetical protein